MNEAIKKLLVGFLSNCDMVASWGVSDIRVGEAQMSFSVSGLLASGRMSISCCDGTYEIFLNGHRLSVEEDVAAVLDRIDGKIECRDSCIEDVLDWLSALPGE